MNQSIAILCGGGPAPGINTVVGSIAKTFIKDGYRILGLHEGYKGLFSAQPRCTEIDFVLADQIFNRGGSFLMMSRFKPSEDDFSNRFNLDFFVKNNVKLLVTIGGDDTASSANRIAKFLQQKNYAIANIHVPKTIDNDLPLPHDIPTFGYHSALAESAHIGAIVMEDARTSGNWFVVSAMGRSAGHLALGIGSSCHYPMIVIPEMFNKTDITVEKIVNMAVSSIIKRKILGINYGAIVVSEGVFHFLSDQDLKNTGVHFSYDDHGHPELGKLSKAHLFNELLEKKLSALKIKIKTRPVEIGYEVRCGIPTAYDLVYCTHLGIGVHSLFTKGITACLVYLDTDGEVKPLYLKDIQDTISGKILPRGVNMQCDRVNMVFNNLLHYITKDDYSAAKVYVANPSEYDFNQILGWN
ncbi:MAG: 6-phosphofructokinase [Prevotellaceae bacterium]|nr:6-phosphofructokinase [Prevotellaceae bacterium]